MANGESYNLDHQRIGMLEGAYLLADAKKCTIGNDVIGKVRISTVFLVIDHSHGTDAVPVLYETMVFDAKGRDIWCDRYSSREAALAGHDRACAWVRSPDLAASPLVDVDASS